MLRTQIFSWHILIYSPALSVLERLPFPWSTLFFLEGKTAFWVVIAGDRGVLRCLRSTGLFLILTGLVLLKRPPFVSSLPRADPLHLVQSWRPLSPLKQTWSYPCLIHDAVTCSDSCEQHWQTDSSSERRRETNTIRLSIPYTHVTLSHVTSPALKCICFMSSLTCGQLAYKSSRFSGGVVTTHGHVKVMLQAVLSFNLFLSKMTYTIPNFTVPIL